MSALLLTAIIAIFSLLSSCGELSNKFDRALQTCGKSDLSSLRLTIQYSETRLSSGVEGIFQPFGSHKKVKLNITGKGCIEIPKDLDAGLITIEASESSQSSGLNILVSELPKENLTSLELLPIVGEIEIWRKCGQSQMALPIAKIVDEEGGLLAQKRLISHYADSPGKIGHLLPISPKGCFSVPAANTPDSIVRIKDLARSLEQTMPLEHLGINQLDEIPLCQIGKVWNRKNQCEADKISNNPLSLTLKRGANLTPINLMVESGRSDIYHFDLMSISDCPWLSINEGVISGHIPIDAIITTCEPRVLAKTEKVQLPEYAFTLQVIENHEPLWQEPSIDKYDYLPGDNIRPIYFKAQDSDDSITGYKTEVSRNCPFITVNSESQLISGVVPLGLTKRVCIVKIKALSKEQSSMEKSIEIEVQQASDCAHSPPAQGLFSLKLVNKLSTENPKGPPSHALSKDGSYHIVYQSKNKIFHHKRHFNKWKLESAFETEGDEYPQLVRKPYGSLSLYQLNQARLSESDLNGSKIKEFFFDPPLDFKSFPQLNQSSNGDFSLAVSVVDDRNRNGVIQRYFLQEDGSSLQSDTVRGNYDSAPVFFEFRGKNHLLVWEGHSIQHYKKVGELWAKMPNFGDCIESRPSPIIRQSNQNQLEVIVSRDARMTHYIFQNNRWTRGASFGANIQSAPSIVQDQQGLIHGVVAEGDGIAIYSENYDYIRPKTILESRIAYWRTRAFLCQGSFPSKVKFTEIDIVERCDDGNSIFFSGLLCAAGSELGCQSVRDSQNEAGRFFRSPKRLAENSGKFSGTSALGALLYLAKTKDKAAFKNWLDFVDSTTKSQCHLIGMDEGCDQVYYCPDSNCTVPEETLALIAKVANWLNISYDHLTYSTIISNNYKANSDVKLVEATIAKSPHSDPASSGWRLHYSANIGMLHRVINNDKDTAPWKTRFSQIKDKEPLNLYYRYLAQGSTPEIVTNLIQTCPIGEGNYERSQWMWERSSIERTSSQSMFWDCIFLAKLLNKIPEEIPESSEWNDIRGIFLDIGCHVSNSRFFKVDRHIKAGKSNLQFIYHAINVLYAEGYLHKQINLDSKEELSSSPLLVWRWLFEKVLFRTPKFDSISDQAFLEKDLNFENRDQLHKVLSSFLTSEEARETWSARPSQLGSCSEL